MNASWGRALASCLVLGSMMACATTFDGIADTTTDASSGKTTASSGSSSGSSGSVATSGTEGTSSGSGSGSMTIGSNINGSDDATTPAEDGSSGDAGNAAPGDAGNTEIESSTVSSPDASKGSTSSDAGENPACKKKICVDPVFDCPLQGCFKGCTNFFCN